MLPPPRKKFLPSTSPHVRNSPDCGLKIGGDVTAALYQLRTHAVQQGASHSITSSAIASSVVGMSRPQQSRMWTPRCGRQQLDLLCHDKRSELRGKAFHEVLAGEDPCPVLPRAVVCVLFSPKAPSPAVTASIRG
jgi:hypothetical protein